MAGRRWIALGGIALSIALLVPGLIAPVISIRGNLQPEGIAELAPKLLDQGVSDKTVEALTPMLNPVVVIMAGGAANLRTAIVNQLSTALSAQLKTGQPIEVYSQTRSILGSIRHLYEVGSPLAATLILVFSVLVPFAKASLSCWAVMQRDMRVRQRTLGFVAAIAKWSMADVFAVALFIAYLAAKASQAPNGPGTPNPVITFSATFGSGFYWFAAYCLFSLATQQVSARAAARMRAAL